MNIAVIFAGGAGTRMYSKDKPKQFLELYHKPIIIHTLEHFDDNPEIDAIVISCLSDWISYLEQLIQEHHLQKVRKIVPGGETGQLSIYHGLCAAREVAGEDADDSIVLIHDGVRPMITQKLITDNIHSVRENGSSITTGPVTETLLEVDEESKGILRVPSRRDSRVAKAPQSFRLRDILAAHERAMSEGRDDFIDSCTMMHHYGYSLTLIEGPAQNIKITTQEDYYLMRAMLEAEENEQLYSVSERV
ncbi:MAG: 2-C-methyl-D-erythritol 4-phosphate cytidylyltransferase [Eubacterium sp.]|nr:2-C-methyl-D-erythritol 4-phosphate cytidylyltransferase [Eubacterium sp.]